ncbi:MAG TPA: hypothetical protein RMH99_14275 [Sandaracinaceae bacterium LLY-WYZ-13_1]|nr:hypothetical protein [Sandaracinaceae bacterium LLY-WYZ-13_1]
MRRLANTFALLGALAAMAAGCGDPQPPVNRVGVNVVEKSAFTGSWYMHQTIVDLDYSGAPTGYVGANAGDGTAGFLGVAIPRIRWVIDENFLYAYRDYETVGDPDDPLRVRGEEDEDYLGQPVAAFPIESHFDIRREYNSVTGEERNVVVENTTDRHWYERQFMRVDWSQNLVAPAFTGPGGPSQAEAAQFFVQDESSFPEEWRPQFHFMSCDGADDTECDADDRDWATDYDQGDLYSMSFTTQAFLAPSPDPMFGITCRFSDQVEQFYPSFPECTTTKITVRTSFLRVSDTREYAPVDWTLDRFNRAGYFAFDRTTYDRTSEAGDPSYGVTDFTNRSANRHNIWQQWFQRDGDGNIVRDDDGEPMLLPYDERDVREIVWYTSRELPAHLVKPSWELVGQWNEVMMTTVRELRGEQLPQYGEVDCQTDDPGGYCFCQTDPRDGTVLNPTCPGRYDPFTAPSEANVSSGEPFDCYVAAVDENGEVVGNALDNEPDWNDAGLSDQDFEPWFGTAMVGSECVNVLRVNTCHQGNVDEWDQLDCQTRGDIRYKLLSFVNQAGTPFLGVAQMRGDPITGEIITGDANIGGPAMDSQRTRAMETYDLINGNITDAQYYTGEDVRAYLNALDHVQLPAPPRLDFSAALRAGVSVDPSVRSGISGVMGRAMERAELLQGAEGRAAIFSDRIHELAGTDLEARLVQGPDALALGGLDAVPEGMAPDGLNERVRDAVSPFRDGGLLSRYEDAREHELQLGLHNMIMPNEYTDDSVLSFVNEHRDWQRVRVEFELNRRLYRDTQVHEMGHCLGLRHHFGGTADPNNYFDGYYTIDEQFPLPDPNDFNTDGVPGLSPDEQIAFEDAYEEARELRELAGIDQWMNSSVMDYTPEWYQRINGAGYHDYMAISFGYGDIVDIYDNSAAADGTARPALPVTEITPVNTRRVGIKYYHGGETCDSDAECPYSTSGSRSNQLLSTNMESGLTQTCVPSGTEGVNVCSNFDDDARALRDSLGANPRWVPVEYFYCEDYRAILRTLPGCATFDAGDSFRQIVRNQTEAYERSYLFNNFRRYRRTFSTLGYGSRVVRYIEPLLGIYTNLIHRYWSDPEFRETTGPFGFEDQFLATADILNFFARMMAQPSIGSYEYNAGWDRYELVSLDEEPDAQVVVPFGQGRYLNSIYQTGLTGIQRVERVGSFYDSIYAMLFMTSRYLSPYYGADIGFQTNFYDIFPNEVQQIFTGMIAARPEDYMPRLQCAEGSTLPRCDDPRIVYMDFYRGDCSIDPETGEPRTETCRPNPAEVTYRDLEVLNGGTRFSLQSYAAIYSLQSFPIYYDTAFQNQMFLCVEGQGNCNQPEAGAVEGVDYVRHTSRRFGKSFLAWQVDATETVAEQTSIAFAMVKEARDTDFIIRMLQTYRGDFRSEMDPPPDRDYLTPDQQAELAAIGYELPESESQIQFEIDRLDSRLRNLEGFFFYLVQLERAFGIDFPLLYTRPEI